MRKSTIWCYALITMVTLGQSVAAKTKITFSTDWPAEQFKGFLTEFKKKHPNIDVSMTATLSPERIWTQIASGSPPDVLYVRGTDVQMYIKSQVLEPLDKYIKMSGTKMNDFVAESIKPYKDTKGAIYALPYDWCPMMTCYNRAHLRAAGIGDLTEKFTFDDLKNLAYKLRVTNGTRTTRWGFYTSYGGWPFEGMWLKPFGGRIYNDDETQILITSREAVKGLEYAQQLFTEKLVGGSFPKTASITFYGTWEFKNLVKVKEDWDISPMPKGPAAYAGSAMGSGYSIAKNSKHKKEAWTFINELMGPRGMELVWAKGTTPSRKSGLRGFYDNYPKVSMKYVDFALDNSWAGRPMMPPGEMATNAVIDPILSKLQSLKISPEQAARDIKSGVEALWKAKRRKK